MGTPNRWALPTAMSAPMEPGLPEEGEGEEVGGDDGQGVRFVEAGDVGREVADVAVGAGILEYGAEDLRRVEVGGLAFEDLDA
jgi:hypothetical protein